MSRLPLLFALVAAVPCSSAAQLRPNLSLGVGLAAMVETWSLSHIQVPSTWHPAASLRLRVALPLADPLSISAQTLAFWGADGRRLQSGTVGLEYRAGRQRRIPVSLGLGLGRQPDEILCIDACPANTPRFAYEAHPTAELSVAYEFAAAGRLRWGPEIALTRALTSGLRYYGVFVGVRATRPL